MKPAPSPVAAAEGPRRRPGGLPAAAALGCAALAGLAGGGLTQLGQSSLPEALGSLANSGSPWVLLAVGVALAGRTARVAAACGVVALLCLESGYVAAAALRGLDSAWTTVAFWWTAALAFGPVAGLAAFALRTRRAPWDSVGGGLVAGVVSGEALVSWVTVGGTTSTGYWAGQVAVGAVLGGVMARRTGWPWTAAAFALGVLAMVATRFVPVLGA